MLTIDGQDRVISKGMINYWISKNGDYIKDGSVVNKNDVLQHKNQTLKNFYDTTYNKSDKAKSSNFWNEIIIQDTGEKLITLIE